MTLKAILFDLDGTLVSSEDIHYQLWVEILNGYGIPFSEQEYKRLYAGMPSAANAVDMIKRYALNTDPERLLRAKIHATHAYLAHQSYPLMPHVRETIASFEAQGLILAIVTGADGISVMSNVHAHDLQRVFATIVSGDDVVHNKPAPDCYLLAMSQLGLRSDECVAIEDSEHGVMAASQAGVACLAIPNAMSVDHDFSRATAVLSSLQDAQDWVAQRVFQA